MKTNQVRVDGPERVFGKIFDDIGFGEIREELFRHLVITRLIAPGSKLKTVDYLERYKGLSIDISRVYRFMDTLHRSLKEQVEQMKNGSVIIDLAADQGGNCELSKMDKIVVKNGVKIIGTTISPESVSTNASELFGKNMYNYIKNLAKDAQFDYNLEDEITDATLIVKEGVIRQNGNTK